MVLNVKHWGRGSGRADIAGGTFWWWKAQWGAVREVGSLDPESRQQNGTESLVPPPQNKPDLMSVSIKMMSSVDQNHFKMHRSFDPGTPVVGICPTDVPAQVHRQLWTKKVTHRISEQTILEPSSQHPLQPPPAVHPERVEKSKILALDS